MNISSWYLCGLLRDVTWMGAPVLWRGIATIQHVQCLLISSTCHSPPLRTVTPFFFPVHLSASLRYHWEPTETEDGSCFLTLLCAFPSCLDAVLGAGVISQWQSTWAFIRPQVQSLAQQQCKEEGGGEEKKAEEEEGGRGEIGGRGRECGGEEKWIRSSSRRKRRRGRGGERVSTCV